MNRLHTLCFLILSLVSTSDSQNLKKHLSLRFTNPKPLHNKVMTKYYRKSNRLVDHWKSKIPDSPRKHNFKRWEYEAPTFRTASNECSGEIPKKWQINGGAPKWGFAEWKFACGYRNPPEYVQKYYNRALPWRRRRPESQFKYRRLPKRINYEERYNY